MNSLFNELKRRNVIRVGAAYLVAAWLILQIVGVLIDIMEMPIWIGKLLVVMLAIGFPLALIFAWAFELTPEGLKAEVDVDRNISITGVTAKKLNIVTIGLVITALVIFTADRFLFSGGTRAASGIPTSAVSSLEPSVAVMPFENISQDVANEPFTIGIHDDLLTQISKVGSIKTISRTSVLQYKDRTQSVAEIAAALGVATVMEGGVQRAGNMVRINVQLVDARTNAQLWAERYERQLTASNIFVIQSEIVKAIADALQTTLSAGERSQIEKVPTENLAALEFYFRGRERLESRNTDAIKEAIEYYQQAIDLDPDFALAYVGLSDGYQLLEDAGDLSRDEMFSKTKAALERALALDSQSGPAYTSLAGLKWTAGDYPDAEVQFRKSIELNPNYARAHLWYGQLLFDWSRVDEAISAYREGIKRDPLSSQLNESLGAALEYQGQFDEALDQYQKSAKINSTFSTSYMYIGNIYWMASGSMGRAAACHKMSIDLDPGARLPQVYLGLLNLDLGDQRQAEERLGAAQRLAPESLESMAAIALLDAYRGKNAEALRNAANVQEINPYFPDARLLQTMSLALLRNHELQEGRSDDARAWYEQSYPALLDDNEPTINSQNYRPAIDIAYLLQKSGDDERAALLLDRSLALIETGAVARLGIGGYGIADVQIHALRGDRERALVALRQAIDQGWRGFWWFYLKNNPNLESLRDSAEFQSMVQELESFMTTEREALSETDSCTSSAWHMY